MINYKESAVVLQAEYLYNEKTGNGFVVSSHIQVKGETFDVSPVYLPEDLIQNVLNGEPNRALKNFKQLSIKKEFTNFDGDLDNVIDNALINPVIGNLRFNVEKDIKLSYSLLKHSHITRERKPMAHVEVKVDNELEGWPKIVFEYSVLTGFIKGTYKKKSFVSKTEQSFIDNFNNLSIEDQQNYYASLKKSMSHMIS